MSNANRNSSAMSNQCNRMNEYFIPKDGIERDVITADICRYLGADALVRPGTYNDDNSGKHIDGFYVTAEGNLTASMVEGLKIDSARWNREKSSRGDNRVPRSTSANAYGNLDYPPQQASVPYDHEGTGMQHETSSYDYVTDTMPPGFYKPATGYEPSGTRGYGSYHPLVVGSSVPGSYKPTKSEAGSYRSFDRDDYGPTGPQTVNPMYGRMQPELSSYTATPQASSAYNYGYGGIQDPTARYATGNSGYTATPQASGAYNYGYVGVQDRRAGYATGPEGHTVNPSSDIPLQSEQTDEDFQKRLGRDRHRLGHNQDRFGHNAVPESDTTSTSNTPSTYQSREREPGRDSVRAKDYQGRDSGRGQGYGDRDRGRDRDRERPL